MVVVVCIQMPEWERASTFSCSSCCCSIEWEKKKKKGWNFTSARDPVYLYQCNYVCCYGLRAHSTFSFNFKIVRRNDMNVQPYQRKPICQVKIMRCDIFFTRIIWYASRITRTLKALSKQQQRKRKKSTEKKTTPPDQPIHTVHAKEFQNFQRVNVAWPTGMCG